jgi:hypothetical protein
MKFKISKNRTIGFALLMSVFTLFITSCQKTDLSEPGNVPDNSVVNSDLKLQWPDVPDSLQVPPGNRLIMHVYASGVQIYKVTQSVTDPNVYLWSFVAPSATLYYDPSYSFIIGTHYLGPTWETKNGSTVVGSVQVKSPQDPTAVPWLLLGAVSNSPGGVFKNVNYIQRVNTVGGIAPITGADADHLGEQDSIDYTADYYFYQPK